MSELSDKLATMPDLTVEFTFTGLDDGWPGAPDPKHFRLYWKAEVKCGDKSHTFDYFTGSAWLKLASKYKDRAKTGYMRKRFLQLDGSAYSADDAIKHGYAKPEKPSAADLLHGLISDAGAMDQTFEDWCFNLGMDTDSRKALETYLACQEGGARLIKVIGYDAFNALRGLEH